MNYLTKIYKWKISKLLDTYARLRKTHKNELKFKAKPWIKFAL